MTPLRPLVAGNWKMNGVAAALGEVERLAAAFRASPARDRADVLICAPATLLTRLVAKLNGTGIGAGGQDCHAKASGAHTGDIAAEMLADAGAQSVIVGHSERRVDHGERDADVRAKAEAARRAGLTAIICIGETLGQREAGLTLEVVGRQLTGSFPANAAPDATIIAYEPVWAIGTGLTPTAADVAAVHAHIRKLLGTALPTGGDRVRILYGGSVKPGNARELMGLPNVNGALVGGASLKADDFIGIIAAYA